MSGILTRPNEFWPAPRVPHVKMSVVCLVRGVQHGGWCRAARLRLLGRMPRYQIAMLEKRANLAFISATVVHKSGWGVTR
jgi:hypothetical protein